MTSLKKTIERLSRPLRLRFMANRWGDLVYRVGVKSGRDRVGDMAAAISYYVLLSVFPLLLGLIGLLGLFLPSQSVQSSLLDFFHTYLPGTTSDVITHNIDAVIRLRAPLGVVGLVGLLWTGSTLFSSVNRFVNYAWGAGARRYTLRKLQDIGLVLATGLLFFVSQGVAAFAFIAAGFNSPLLLALGSRFLAFFMAFLMFLFTYKFMPTVEVRWGEALPGAVLGTVLFEALQTLFVQYLSVFGDYTAVYGPLASVVAFLVWVYVSALVLILGAEFGSEWGKARS